MGFTPYDWNENIQHRLEYVQSRLRQGMPVVGRRFAGGVLLLSVRRSQRKVFEIFDHILFSAIGSQSDVEAIRISSIDFASQEGFNRSPDDVSVQRLVAGLSPQLKKAFADGFGAPFIIKGMFAEVGRAPDQDQFTVLGYDGEYAISGPYAVVAGTREAENRMNERLERDKESDLSLPDAVRSALEAWAEGQSAVLTSGSGDGEEADTGSEPSTLLKDALDARQVEVGVLERRDRVVRFRMLTPEEIGGQDQKKP